MFDLLHPTRKPSAALVYRHELGIESSVGPSEWVIGGLCPFHSDRRVGSFRLNLHTGAFRCFACGARGGDVIAFVRLRHCLTFREAIQHLARLEGGSL